MKVEGSGSMCGRSVRMPVSGADKVCDILTSACIASLYDISRNFEHTVPSILNARCPHALTLLYQGMVPPAEQPCQYAPMVTKKYSNQHLLVHYATPSFTLNHTHSLSA
jgi:hypothetical protein